MDEVLVYTSIFNTKGEGNKLDLYGDIFDEFSFSSLSLRVIPISNGIPNGLTISKKVFYEVVMQK